MNVKREKDEQYNTASNCRSYYYWKDKKNIKIFVLRDKGKNDKSILNFLIKTRSNASRGRNTKFVLEMMLLHENYL